MERRLMKFVFVPSVREDRLLEVVKGTEILDVGYAGGTALHLLVAIPIDATGKPELEMRSFRRFDLGDVVPMEYVYVGHVRVATEWVFIFERRKV